MNVEMSTEIGQLATALARAQGEIKGAVKGSENPFYSSRYADLQSVIEACRPALPPNGLAVCQIPSYDPEKNLITVETVLLHSSGQYIRGRLASVPVREVTEYIEGKKTMKEVESRTPQAIGSCITYLRRYSYQAFSGVAAEDDDGNAASGKTGREAQEEVASRKIAELKQRAELPEQVRELADVIQRLTDIDKTLSPDGIIRTYFKTAKGEILTWDKVRRFKTQKQLRWAAGGVEAIRRMYAGQLSEHPENQSQEPEPAEDPLDGPWNGAVS